MSQDGRPEASKKLSLCQMADRRAARARPLCQPMNTTFTIESFPLPGAAVRGTPSLAAGHGMVMPVGVWHRLVLREPGLL